MMLPVVYRALVALYFLPSVLAAASTLSACTTKLGRKSTSKVGSTTYALTYTVYATTKQTNTPTITNTPAPTTISVSSTTTLTDTTTLPQVTDTFSTTSSFFETSTQTETVTETSVTTTDVTVTADQSTRTIEPSPGFVPAASVVPAGQASTGMKRDVLPERRGRIQARAEAQLFIPKNGKPTFKPALYPTAVTCGALVRTTSTRTSLFTAAPTTTTLIPGAVSVTVPVTTTSTSTVVPENAQTTLSFSTTITATTTTTVTTTTTQTATNTVTVTQPEATFYAACASNNLVTGVNGNGISQVYVYGFFDTSPSNTGYDCCVSCLNTPGCASSALYYGTCYRINTGSCSVDQNTGYFQTTSSYTPSNNFLVSNSNCGQLSYGGNTS